MGRRYSWAGGLAAALVALSGQAAAGDQREGPQRVAPQGPPTVRILRTSPPSGCADWGAITVQACRTTSACDASKVGSRDVGALSDALESTISATLARSCRGLSCGPVRTRNDTNNFACRGRSALCMTRTLEYTCLRTSGGASREDAPRRTAPPRDSDPPTRTAPPRSRPTRVPPPDDEAPPRRTGPTRVAPDAGDDAPPARANDRLRSAGPADPAGPIPAHLAAEEGDPFEPVGGSGQAGMASTRRGSVPQRVSPPPRSTRSASSAPRRVAGGTGKGYPFVGKADELESGEYWYWKAPDDHGGGTQKYAYDLTSARFDEGTNRWTECRTGSDGKPKCTWCSDAASNADCLVYNEPLYAMASGVVERCWRNAPENPSPGESHWGRTSEPKRIGGGGNALVVRNDDGTYALYAHMKPGTIPSSLCPKTGVLMNDATDKSEATIPEGQQPRVKAGQFVGRVGNTGASSNPHVHVHLQDGPDKTSNGVPLNFTGGYITEADTSYEDSWERLDGRTRPTDFSAFWPNFSAGLPEIAYHGLSAALYQKLFDHASGSGYRLEWIDGFVVKGKTYFNVLFRPRKGLDWAASHNLTGQQYQDMVDKRKGEGLRLFHADSYLVGNTIYYAAIFVKDGKQAAAYHGATQADHQKKFDAWTDDGWRPRSISVASVNGTRYYTGVYEKAGGGFLSRSALTGAEYQKLTTDQYDAGRQLVYLNAYEHDGQPYFSAIYAPLSGPKRARHGLSGAEYQDQWQEAREASLRTRCVTGYLQGGTVRYAAAWGQ
jgi:murein DD-endopeptidase MepM/ murein hydrolase activator NlpD